MLFGVDTIKQIVCIFARTKQIPRFVSSSLISTHKFRMFIVQISDLWQEFLSFCFTIF